MKYAITGATGQLGRLVVSSLIARGVAPAHIVAAVRSPQKAADLAALGGDVRRADYTQPATLTAAFAGVDRLLLISSSEVGQRAAQHRAVIEAARTAGVKLVAYTSILHADTSGLGLATEHKETEAMLRASGLPFALLRNGWYTENYTAGIGAALAHGAVLGGAGEGRLSTAARADYADAAAAVLTAQDDPAGQIYELAGDTAFTLKDYAAEIARVSGKPVVYRDLPQAEYQAALVGVGLPEGFAALLADSDAWAAKGHLYDASGTLGRLIGRATTPMATTVAAAVKAA